MDDKKLYSGLSPELQEKAKSCKSAEELMKLANENDIVLSDEQLDAISGGCRANEFGCHADKCGVYGIGR